MKRLIAVCCLGLFLVGACSQKRGWDRTVDAASAERLAACRDRLLDELGTEQLKDFDTAIQELKLDAMNRGIAGPALREDNVRSILNGKTVEQAILLGWRARHSRIERELKDMTDRLSHDSRLADRPARGETSRTLSNLIQNEQDIIAQLNRERDETDNKIKSIAAHAAR